MPDLGQCGVDQDADDFYGGPMQPLLQGLGPVLTGAIRELDCPAVGCCSAVNNLCMVWDAVQGICCQ